MPIKNFLKPEQIRNLQQALKESESPHFRERVLMFLLQNDGKTIEGIADFLGCSPRTVAYWCVHGDPDNLESLRNKREQENYRKVTSEYLKILLLTVEKEPSELGYEFGRWTGERLSAYLVEKTGIKISGAQIRRILKQKKYSYIWSKYSLEDKQDPIKRAEFKEKLKKYLAITKENPDYLQIWFWAQSRRTEYSARRTCAMKRASVSELFDAKLGAKRVKEKKSQDNDSEAELTLWEASASMTGSACVSLLKKEMRILFMNSCSS